MRLKKENLTKKNKQKTIIIVLLTLLNIIVIYQAYKQFKQSKTTDLPIHQVVATINKMFNNEKNFDQQLLNDIVHKYNQIKWINIFDKNDQLLSYNTNAEIDQSLLENCNNTDIIGVIHEIKSKNIFFNRICIEPKDQTFEVCFGIQNNDEKALFFNGLISCVIFILLTLLTIVFYFWRIRYVKIDCKDCEELIHLRKRIEEFEITKSEYENKTKITYDKIQNENLLFPYLLTLFSVSIEKNKIKYTSKDFRYPKLDIDGFKVVQKDERQETKRGILYKEEESKGLYIIKPAQYYALNISKIEKLISSTIEKSTYKYYTKYLSFKTGATSTKGNKIYSGGVVRLYIRGKNLRQYYDENISILLNGKEKKLLDLMLNICEALIKLKKDCKISHNNLKLNNIIVESENSVVLVDYIPLSDGSNLNIRKNREQDNNIHRQEILEDRTIMPTIMPGHQYQKLDEEALKIEGQIELCKFGLLLYEFFTGKILLKQRIYINNYDHENTQSFGLPDANDIEKNIQKLTIHDELKEFLKKCLFKEFDDNDDFYSNFYSLNILHFLMGYNIKVINNADIYQHYNKSNELFSDDSTSDIFSLGIIMFELLTSEKPFIPDLMSKILSSSSTNIPFIDSIYSHYNLKSYLKTKIDQSQNCHMDLIIDIIFKCLSNDYKEVTDIKNDIISVQRELTDTEE